DGKLRQTAFLGLREDKPAAEVRLERPSPPTPTSTTVALPRVALPRSTRLTHPKKPLFVPPGITKEELAHHYARVAERMLPHVAGRPLTLLRCPDGHHRPCFFQKHWNEQLPPSILAVEVKEKLGDDDTALYTTVESLEGLLA